MEITPRAKRAFNEWQKYVAAYNNYHEENSDDEDFYDNYWNDETAAFGWQRSKENPEHLLLVYELAVGGPNAHLVFTYKLEEVFEDYTPEVEQTGTEFQFHWWSPVSKLDLTEIPKDVDYKTRELFETAYTCLEQIEEEAMTMLENNYEEILQGKN